MEQKHTPGPWKSKNKSVYIDPKVEANPFNQWIAECRNTEDAELIARAPELLQQVAELREERKELVEALREADATFRILRFEPTMSGTVFASFDRRKFISALCAWQEKIESLLSKFEVPNQS